MEALVVNVKSLIYNKKERLINLSFFYYASLIRS
nr:MAG TPA: hypothetical protein [Bacteriophage sp.]